MHVIVNTAKTGPGSERFGISTYFYWTMSWENMFLPYANNKGADQPAHPRSLIGAFVVRCLDSIIPILAKSTISRLIWAGWFESYMVENPEDRFFRDVAPLDFRQMSKIKTSREKKSLPCDWHKFQYMLKHIPLTKFALGFWFRFPMEGPGFYSFP